MALNGFKCQLPTRTQTHTGCISTFMWNQLNAFNVFRTFFSFIRWLGYNLDDFTLCHCHLLLSSHSFHFIHSFTHSLINATSFQLNNKREFSGDSAHFVAFTFYMNKKNKRHSFYGFDIVYGLILCMKGLMCVFFTFTEWIYSLM